jgi:tetratricopeptide (TPR) repeat protein
MVDGDLQRARALLDVGRFEQARHALGQYLAGSPQSLEALCLLARSHQLGRNYQDMLDAADQAVATAPSSEWAHRLRSIALGKLRLPIQALTSARRAVELAPYAWQPYVIMVDALLATGGADARRDAFQAAVHAQRLAPHEPEVHNSRGRVFQAISDPGSARRSYREALRLDPQNPTARNNLAIVELRQGRTTLAGKRLGEVLADRPTESLYQDNARTAARTWGVRLMDAGSAIWLGVFVIGLAGAPPPVLVGACLALLAGGGTLALRRYRRLPPALRRLVRRDRWPLLGAATQATTALVVALLWRVHSAPAAVAIVPALVAMGIAFFTVLRVRNRAIGAVVVFCRRWWYRLVVLRRTS